MLIFLPEVQHKWQPDHDSAELFLHNLSVWQSSGKYDSFKYTPEEIDKIQFFTTTQVLYRGHLVILGKSYRLVDFI